MIISTFGQKYCFITGRNYKIYNGIAQYVYEQLRLDDFRSMDISEQIAIVEENMASTIMSLHLRCPALPTAIIWSPQ